MDSFNLRLTCEEITPKTQGLGAVLGQKKIKPIDFCNSLNSFLKSKNIDFSSGGLFSKRMIIKVIKTSSTDFYILDVNPFITTEILKDRLGIKGSSKPGKKNENEVSMDLLIEIAKAKQPFFFTDCFDSVLKSVIGTAKSMGLKVS